MVARGEGKSGENGGGGRCAVVARGEGKSEREGEGMKRRGVRVLKCGQSAGYGAAVCRIPMRGEQSCSIGWFPLDVVVRLKLLSHSLYALFLCHNCQI